MRPLLRGSAFYHRPAPVEARAYDVGMHIARRLSGWLAGRDDGERAPSPDDLVLLAKPNGEPEALMLKEILANNGVHSMMKNRDGFTSSRNAPGPWWSYELWVLQRDYERATELIGADGAEEEA